MKNQTYQSAAFSVLRIFRSRVHICIHDHNHLIALHPVKDTVDQRVYYYIIIEKIFNIMNYSSRWWKSRCGLRNKKSNHPNQFSEMMMGQYWLAQTTFKIDPKFSQKWNFLPTDCLPEWCLQTSMHNSITTKTMSLIFFTVWYRFSLRCAFWHTAVRMMHSSWTNQYPPLYSIHLCWQQKCQFGGTTWWFPLHV